IEANEPLRVYDTSGPWGDPNVDVDVTCGLPPLRADWIRARGDVEDIEGRKVLPLDDGYLSERHAASRNDDNRKLSAIRNPQSAIPCRPLRAKPGKVVTQLWYARQGIVTPEMEFIAIRENGGRASSLTRPVGFQPAESNDLYHQHPGESFGANIPPE